MKDVILFLKKLNLSSTEISLYLNGLKYHSVQVAKLVETSKVKRTTAYHALDTLVEKGLASRSKQDGKLRYKMTPPEELEKLLSSRKSQLESQLRSLDQLIPQFPKPIIAETEIPDVTNYYGTEGVHAAIDKALYCKSKVWRIISPKDNFFRNSTKEYVEYFKEMRDKRDIKAMSLWEITDTATIDEESEISRRQPRILPKAMHGKFKSTIIIFDNSVLIVSSYSKQFATIISSDETAATLGLMFDAIWTTSRPVELNL